MAKPERTHSNVIAAVFALALGCCGNAWAEELKLGDLMQLLAQQKSARASFVERKLIGFMEQAVESAGELAFIAPDRLEKRTLRPKPELLRLEGDTLTIESAGKKTLTIKLQSQPEALAFVESIRGTLAGDQAALSRYYKLTLSGSAEQWHLALVPSQSRMLAIVSRIRIDGNGPQVRQISFEQADGDRTEMQITKSGTP